MVVQFSLQSAPRRRARLGDGAEGGAAAQGNDAFRVETDEPTLAHLRDAFPAGSTSAASCGMVTRGAISCTTVMCW